MEYHGILKPAIKAPDCMRHLNNWGRKTITFFNAIIVYISMQNIVTHFHVRNQIKNNRPLMKNIITKFQDMIFTRNP